MSHTELQFPKYAPIPGLYYHYKHDPSKGVANYVYEVLNIGNHTETDEYLVVYRPLYESSVYKAGKMWDVRPLSMFVENVETSEGTKMRFTLITDPTIIEQLETIKRELYS